MRTLVAALLALALGAACAPAAAPGGTPEVLTTTTLLADLAANVAGDRARVTSIAPKGAHVEEYEPTPDDAKRVARAGVIFVNGRGLDAWADGLLRGAPAGARVVVLTDGLPDIDGNPHHWFDVGLAKAYGERMRDALGAADPGGRDGYASRAAAYAKQLDALDAELRRDIGALPEARRRLVTSHDAFPYFAKAYGFEVVGATLGEEGKEPSAAELAALVRAVRAANVPAVFVEEGVSPALAQTLAREAGIQRVVTGLPTDSLLDPPADTYVGLMRTLVRTIVGALR